MEVRPTSNEKQAHEETLWARKGPSNMKDLDTGFPPQPKVTGACLSCVCVECELLVARGGESRKCRYSLSLWPPVNLECT